MPNLTLADISYQAANASAKEQMQFQERMSNTAHQREIADLKKAGLNPVLSAGGQGAAVTNGAEGFVGDANAKLFDEQVAAYNLAQKELEQQFKLDMLNAETNAKIQLETLKNANNVLASNSSVKSGKSHGKSSGKYSNVSNGKKNNGDSNNKSNDGLNSNGLTGNADLDAAISAYAKRYPIYGLVVAMAKYAKDNGKVGNVEVSGSTAKAKANYAKNQTKKNSPTGSSYNAIQKYIKDKNLLSKSSSIGR